MRYLNKDILIFLPWILLILVAIFLYAGYIESNTNYYKLCSLTYGIIKESEMEKIDVVTPIKQIKGVGVFKAENKCRLKNKYEYSVNKNKYSGYFYNDGLSDDYLSYKDIKKIWQIHNEKHPLKIYYLISNVNNSCINIDMFKTKNSKFYYGISFLNFLMLIGFLFFSNFLINE